MNILQLDEHLTISEQITEEDVKILADLGIKTLICNRPDNEEPNQISCEQIKSAAENLGVRFVHIPVLGREIPMAALNEFINCIESTDEKIHAYCRTGTRCSIFWGLSQARTLTAESVVKKAQAKGINLNSVLSQLESVYQANHTGG